MNNDTKSLIIFIIMVIGLIIVLILLANEIINYGKIEQPVHGAGDNEDISYLEARYNTTPISWNTSQIPVYYVAAGGGGSGGKAMIADLRVGNTGYVGPGNYTITVGGY
jgi:hypothetical protein